METVGNMRIPEETTLCIRNKFGPETESQRFGVQNCSRTVSEIDDFPQNTRYFAHCKQHNRSQETKFKLESF